MRLDQLLVEKIDSVRSRTQAKELISEGWVQIKRPGKVWEVALKPALDCLPSTEIRVEQVGRFRWVSRSGEKLFAALKKKSCDLKNKTVLDLGQSTGGFTEVSLNQGAAKVVGVEVGHGQLSEKIKKDPRVVCLEGLDVRNLEKHKNQWHIDFVVIDLSFISLCKVLKSLKNFTEGRAAPVMALVKPQFEVGKDKINKSGIVSDPLLHLDCERRILTELEDLEAQVFDYFPSSVRGKDGNQEFFCYFVF